MRSLLQASVLTAALLLSGTAAAADWAFEEFLYETRSVCRYGASTSCLEAAWRFADRNDDDRLALPELIALHEEFFTWADARKSELDQRDASILAMAQLTFASLTPEVLFKGYDSNRDQLLTREELLADVQLDERPIGTVLTDQKAVNWQSVARRLGPIGALLGTFIGSLK